MLQVGTDGNIWIDTATKTISLAAHGLLSDTGLATENGVTLQAFYSYLKEEWKTDAALIKFPFPMTAITPEQFEFGDGWQPADQGTVDLFRDGGFAIKNGAASAEEYVGVITLGTIGASDQVYYQPIDGATTSENIVLTGVVNQCVKVYGDGEHTSGAAHGLGIDNTASFETRSYFKIFVREQAKLYSQSQLSDIGVTTFTYQAYRFPLANADDLKITHTDIEIDATTDGIPDVAPYSDMDITYLDGSGFSAWANATVYSAGAVVLDSTIQSNGSSNGTWWYTVAGGTSSGTSTADDVGVTWVSYTGERQIGTEWRAFDTIIDADVADDGSLPTAEEIYEYVQFSLRQNLDIDAGTGTVTGKTADSLLRFVGDTLVSSQGVYIDQFSSTDINRLEFYDVSNTLRTFPFVAAGSINFNDNLVTDGGAVYTMFFTNDDAGDNSGADFGTSSAIIVQDNDDANITGSISQGTIQFTYDYDGNVQRGGASAGSDAPVTVVAIGLTKAQYVKATSTILEQMQTVYHWLPR